MVIADEAHRSQYDFIDGYARHMRDALPNASFIGFTGTPIELADASTRAVFGDHISVYDIQRAVDDEATVPIYYESRLAELAIDDRPQPQVRRRAEPRSAPVRQTSRHPGNPGIQARLNSSGTIRAEIVHENVHGGRVGSINYCKKCVARLPPRSVRNPPFPVEACDASVAA